MYKMQLLSCIALTLALVANGAPTSSSTENTKNQVKSLLLDLQLLLKEVKNYENLKLFRMHTFKFYMPKKVTELKHLQCLAEELKHLEVVLNLAQSKNQNSTDIKDLMDNINRIVSTLKGSETRFTCEYDDETVTAAEFLNKWITFCQSIYSTMS
ncbi:interleukin-2 [Hippopotamus amphibius kiboko]|uniref:interleukin-2 n=1 Tax=Hippopotamus amphibius kiboko TaxID=575201 RepID=UPI00259ADF0C|nr:interleukin-2 [Hippopotamus amphibius kiboko]